jgi:4-aminobutyrate aminotransferase-like enzyme
LPAWQPAIGGDPDVAFAPFPLCRDCPESGWNPRTRRLPDLDRDCTGRCLRGLEEILETRGSEVAAVLLEPVVGVGGILTACRGFFTRLSRLRAGGTFDLICDEVQTGFGRLGGDWFGFGRFGMEPDLLCLGKGIANGFPLGMTVGTEQAAAAMAEKLHFSTFGGNPVSCAAALATLEILAEDDLPGNARRTGDFLLCELERSLAPLPGCREIRGTGLMIGVELPDAGSAKMVLERCFEGGLLLGLGGRERNVIRIQPPLSFTREMAATAVSTLASAVKEIRRDPGSR